MAGCGSSAGFTVLADGRVVADVPFVRAGAAPVPINAEISAAATLELCVTTGHWEYCHAVWLDPVLEADDGDGDGWQRVVTDPLARADLLVPRALASVERCIVTAASAGFEQWVDDLLGSVRLHGGCPDAALVVLALGDAPDLDRVARSHGATVVRCRPRAALDPNIKSVMYSAGRVIPAARFVCLDADMLVLDDLAPLFAAIDAVPPGGVLVAGEGNDHGTPDLATALDAMYGGGADPPFFQRDSPVGRQRLVVNDGLLAASRTALCALDAEIRALPGVVQWIDADPHVRWRNQFAANVALAKMGSAVELDPSWNVQLHVQDVACEGLAARWRGRRVRVLHFSGWGKFKATEFRDAIRHHLQASLPDADPATPPTVGPGPGTPDEQRVRELCTRGRFEDALALARHLAASGAASPRVADERAWLEKAMAPPARGASEARQRSWASEVPRDVQLRIQQAVHHQRYRGRQLVKNPFDLAMYHQLLERLRPATIVEIGSKEGGSALWLAGLAAGLGVDTQVHSYDIVPVTDVTHPRVTFHHGDGTRLGDAIAEADVRAWARPLLVIDDADHSEATTTAILEFFHSHLEAGDYLVVEDGNLSDLYPELYPEHSSGPHRALRRFFEGHGGDYEVDAALCDLFGYNSTTASNGILRRREPRESRGHPAVADRLAARPWREAEVPPAALAVPSMLSHRERQLLHWLARHHVTGQGRIVDGGSFLGGSTAALASGLAARADGDWEHAIVAHDLFRVETYTLGAFASCLPDPTIGASFRPAFDANVAAWSRLVEVREGDACAWGWSGEPIEVLFLDLVKTWPLNDLVLEKFFPFLIPGHSVIIQQDYLWGYGPWIHMTMELMEPSVTILDAMANGSVAYLLTAPVPEEVLGAKLRDTLSPARQRALMDRAVGRWQGEERGLVELARAMLVADLDGPAAGAAEIAGVLRRHAGRGRVEQCAAIIGSYLG